MNEAITPEDVRVVTTSKPPTEATAADSGSLFARPGSAVLSNCGTYRYRLTRRWGPGPSVLWIMLNPSTADAAATDPTIRRCVGFTKGWGYRAIDVVNLFALRATDPAELTDHPDPIGPDNHEHIVQALGDANVGRVVAAWGAGGMDRAPRAWAVDHLLSACEEARRTVVCLGTTKAGHPRHPLYVKGDTLPEPWLTSSGHSRSEDT